MHKNVNIDDITYIKVAKHTLMLTSSFKKYNKTFVASSGCECFRKNVNFGRFGQNPQHPYFQKSNKKRQFMRCFDDHNVTDKSLHRMLSLRISFENYSNTHKLLSCLSTFGKCNTSLQKIVYGYLRNKPKNSIKIQNPKIQILAQKCFEKRYTLKK